MITVTQEDNAPPLVRIFATKFRAALDHATYTSLVKKSQGQFGLQSKRDPQSLTVTITPTEIQLVSGIQPGCDIVIHLNLDNPNNKPKVVGLLKHPLYAIAVGKLLEFPEPNWADSLKRLWDQFKTYPGMPTGITAKSLDEDRQLTVGDDQETVYLEGKSEDLAEVFSGGSPLIAYFMTGKVKGRYSFQHAVVLSDVTLQMMLGDTQ